MIEVNKIVGFEGTGPFTYQFSASPSAGITFLPAATGVTEESSLEITIQAQDSATLDAAVITLDVSVPCGATDSQVLTIINPCTGVGITGPVVNLENGDYLFSATYNTACLSGSTYTWFFDSSVWEKISQNDTAQTSTLRLRLKTGVAPASAIVSLEASDCENCVSTGSITYSFCVPNLPITDVYLYPVVDDKTGETVYQSTQITLPNPQGCNDFTVDWSTIQLDIPSFLIQEGSSPTFNWRAPDGTLPGVYLGSFTVAGQSGIRSLPGAIRFIIDIPNTGGTIHIPDQVFSLDCSDQPGQTVYFPIEDNLVLAQGAVVDWSSFQVITPPTPLGIVSPTLVTQSDGKHYIAYTVPTPLSADIFSWMISDMNGNPSNGVTFTVTDCIPAPTAVDDSYTLACGTTTLLDVLLNDLGNGSPMDPSTLQITVAPTTGIAIVSAGKIQYVAPPATIGSTTLKYKARNTMGQWTNEATVTITINCAGADRLITVCD